MSCSAFSAPSLDTRGSTCNTERTRDINYISLYTASVVYTHADPHAAKPHDFNFKPLIHRFNQIFPPTTNILSSTTITASNSLEDKPFSEHCYKLRASSSGRSQPPKRSAARHACSYQCDLPYASTSGNQFCDIARTCNSRVAWKVFRTSSKTTFKLACLGLKPLY